MAGMALLPDAPVFVRSL